VNPAVRELVLARALYRCGDRAGLGERILRQYGLDLQGPFARHAHAVLHGYTLRTYMTLETYAAVIREVFQADGEK